MFFYIFVQESTVNWTWSLTHNEQILNGHTCTHSWVILKWPLVTVLDNRNLFLYQMLSKPAPTALHESPVSNDSTVLFDSLSSTQIVDFNDSTIQSATRKKIKCFLNFGQRSLVVRGSAVRELSLVAIYIISNENAPCCVVQFTYWITYVTSMGKVFEMQVAWTLYLKLRPPVFFRKKATTLWRKKDIKITSDLKAYDMIKSSWFYQIIHTI